jgi:hypothetical protein
MTGITGVPDDSPVSNPSSLQRARKYADRARNAATRSGSATSLRSAARAAAAFDGVMPTL